MIALLVARISDNPNSVQHAHRPVRDEIWVEKAAQHAHAVPSGTKHAVNILSLTGQWILGVYTFSTHIVFLTEHCLYRRKHHEGCILTTEFLSLMPQRANERTRTHLFSIDVVVLTDNYMQATKTFRRT